MRDRSFYFHFCALLLLCVRARANGATWSDVVNVYEGTMNYSCPNNEAVAAASSDFSTSHRDRQWRFYCTDADTLANTGGTTCTLEDAINTASTDIIYDCPDNGYIGGFASTFDTSTSDRLWRPYCCTRRQASLINCNIDTGTTYANSLRGSLSFTIATTFSNSHRRVIVGMEAYYNSVDKDRRWRYKHCEIEVTCPVPAIPTFGQVFGYDFRYEQNITYACNNSYYMLSGNQTRTCLNSGQFSGEEPICTPCTNITHCQDVRCTNSTNHYCELCESNYGVNKGDRAYDNRHTSCEPLCSWKSNYCYPGVCPSTPESCQCSAGFSGQNCLTVLTPPTLLDCSIILTDSFGNKVEGLCTSSLSLAIYTNILPLEIDLNWNVAFQGPSPPARPSYVVDYKVGVVETHLNATIRRASALSFIVDSEEFDCPDVSFSNSRPRAGPTSCKEHRPLLKTFHHGDRYEMKVVVESGGVLVLRDHDLAINVTKYYRTSHFIGHALFILDFLPPVHCSLISSVDCLSGQSLLDIITPITRTGSTQIMWGGWLDELSDVHSYQIDVYPLQMKGDLQCEQLTDLISSITATEDNSTSSSRRISFSSSGIYSVVMTVTDTAGNERYSRRLVLYDSISTLEIDAMKPIRVLSAVNETVNRWQTDLTKPIIVIGVGHFYNSKLRTNNWLNPICDFHQAIDPDYDQPVDSDSLPRSGTHNADGIVKLEYTVGVDHKGGSSVTELRSWSTIDDVFFSNFSVSIDRMDGDTAKFVFRATDYLGQETTDSVLVNFDASPPTVQEPWLLRNGKQLHLHHSTNLLQMRIQIRAEDEHSGISRIEWSIGTTNGGEDVGNGQISIKVLNPVDCNDASCYCIPTSLCYSRVFDVSLNSQNMKEVYGGHDTDYYISVVVTNQAGLTATSNIKITIDTTPPQTGAVVDSTVGEKDIDYQSDLIYQFSWDGFFDPETDVVFYQYIVDVNCVTAANFSYPASGKAIETQDLHRMWVATSPGQYFVTVVAYNKVLSPAAPVCSDGIIIDQTSPHLEQIFINDIIVQPGLVQDTQKQVWLILADRRQKMVVSPSEECFNNSLIVDDVALYPLHQYQGVVSTVKAEECGQYRPLMQTAYITRSGYVALNWTAFDQESGLLDCEVGLGSKDSDIADIRPFMSTGRHTFTAIIDSNLKHGSQFFVIVKASNQALLSVTKRVGPIVVDTTPPVFSGQLNVRLVSNQLVVSWTDGAFQDQEDRNGIRFQLAIGSTLNTTDVVEYCPVETCFQKNGSSVIVSIDSMKKQLHNGMVYYVFLQATNGASLGQTISSKYVHQVNTPSVGVVNDIKPMTTPKHSWWQEKYGIYLDNEDIDIQTTNSSIAAQWFGFTHDYLPVTYEFGLGSSPHIDDIVSFKPVGSKTTHVESGLSLANQRFYVTIRASNAVGNVTASSDGVLIINELDNDIQQLAVVVDGWNIDSDVDYQSSQSEVRAAWQFPTHLLSMLSHYEWAINELKLNTSYEIRQYHSVATSVTTLAAGLSLNIGSKYYVSVKFCYSDGCTTAVHSDGFYVVGAPVPTTLQAVYNTGSNTAYLQWEPFSDPKMSYYMWSIGTAIDGSQLLIPSGTVTASNDTMMVSVAVNMSAHYPAVVTVSGYNAAGVGAATSIDMEWQVNGKPTHRSAVDTATMTVYDIKPSEVKELSTSDWRQLEHMSSSFTDIQYSAESERVAAAWPSLRYPLYSWSVSETSHYVPCGLPGVVACGDTPANQFVVSDLSLAHGHRYYFCVWSNSTSIQHENFRETLPAIEACSNGVTIDLEPPVGGCVSVGNKVADLCEKVGRKEKQYQAATTEIELFWSGFSDIETEGTAVHASGISHYEYAIGSVTGIDDVVQFTRVVAGNRGFASSLALRDGEIYYATVRATDFVGLSTDAYSPLIVVDSSPPSIGIVTVGDYPSSSTTHIQSLHQVIAQWSQIEDKHSGLASLRWALGSRIGHTDLMPFTTIGMEQMAKTGSLQLSERQLVFVAVLASNKAGVSSMSTSNGYIVDVLPPTTGYVFDGAGSKANNVQQSGEDLDYGSLLTELSAHWGGYYDMGTGIVDYRWAIGSCSGCSDIIYWHSTGLATDGTYEGLSLVSGHTYYSSVKACDGAAFCSSVVTSDGLLVDNSPPVAGYVVDGLNGEDKQYHADRLSVSAHWYDFHDPHSSISYFEWSVGTSPGAADVLTWTNVHLDEKATLTSLVNPLPLNRLLYVSVKAVNKAGLMVIRWSDGFLVDISSPVIDMIPQVDVTWIGSLFPGTQFDRSQVRATWQFSDSESRVVKHYWSLRSHDGSRAPPIPSVLAEGDSAIMTGLNLNDGDRYSVTVTACNGAALCTTAVSDPVLVDSTVPSVGTFAVSVDSAAMIDHSLPGAMIWSNHPSLDQGSLDVAWLGFSDHQSGISHYRVSVGTSYGRGDLDVSATPATISHMAANTTQRAVIPVNRRLVFNEKILISIWAVNGVGGPSPTRTDTFTLITSGDPQFGSLEKERSTACKVHTCDGHCSCAAQGRYCLTQSPCIVYNSTDIPSQRSVIEVSDVIQGRLSSDADFTSSTCSLSAVWAVIGVQTDILWFEWSAGRKGKSVGSGIFEKATEQYWFPVPTGIERQAALLLPTSKQLIPGVSYVFYVRVWYAVDQYTVFQSDGITVDSQPPFVQSGRRVKEVSSLTGPFHDIDYTQSTSDIHLHWEGVFTTRSYGVIEQWRVCIGQSAGVCSLYSSTLSANVSSVMVSALKLTPRVRYYTTLAAVSPVGLEVSSSSDGIVADVEKPVTGFVHDSSDVRDARAQSSKSELSASWHGFLDLDSYIHHYEWAIGHTPGGSNVMAFRDVGLALSATSYGLNLTNGVTYFATVVAVDAVGIRSDAVSSNGIAVDTSRPLSYACFRRSDNLVKNPSFEASSSCSSATSIADITKEWNVDSVSWMKAVAADSTYTYKGCYSLYFFGSISQNIRTIPRTEYRLTFYVSAYNDTSTSSVAVGSTSGTVSIPSGTHTFVTQPTHHETGRQEWSAYFFTFTATEMQTNITFTASGRSGIMIDSVSVDHCLDRREEKTDHAAIINSSRSITVGTRNYFGSSPQPISVNWDIKDTESGIDQYWFAVGTVPGGEQLQRYTSVNQATFANTSPLRLQHGWNIYVSVLAWNGAGRERVVYSISFGTDFTHPQAGTVFDGHLEDQDVDYQSNTIVSASWKTFSDSESGIEECKWAIGSSPSVDDIQGYSTVTGNWLNASRDGLALNHGQRVYVQVICTNGAGLCSHAVSDGVTIVLKNPSSTGAFVAVSAAMPEEYEAETSVLPQTNSLHLSWSGFVDDITLLNYEVKINGTAILPNASVAQWNKVGHVSETFITGLTLQDEGSYRAYVRAVNLAGLFSPPVQKEFSVVAMRPSDTAAPINSSWEGATIKLSWKGKFSSSAIRYELSVGTVPAGSDVLKFIETSETEYSFTPSLLDRSTDFYVVLTAITASGLHSTAEQQFKGSDG